MVEQDDPPSFLAAYFNEPDHSGHKFGPNSPEIKSIIVGWIMSLDICWKVYEIEDC